MTRRPPVLQVAFPAAPVLDNAPLAGVIAAVGMGVKVHGSNAAAARPAGFAQVTWIGSVEPTNAVNGDIWESTA